MTNRWKVVAPVVRNNTKRSQVLIPHYIQLKNQEPCLSKLFLVWIPFLTPEASALNRFTLVIYELFFYYFFFTIFLLFFFLSWCQWQDLNILRVMSRVLHGHNYSGTSSLSLFLISSLPPSLSISSLPPSLFPSLSLLLSLPLYLFSSLPPSLSLSFSLSLLLSLSLSASLSSSLSLLSLLLSLSFLSLFLSPSFSLYIKTLYFVRNLHTDPIR